VSDDFEPLLKNLTPDTAKNYMIAIDVQGDWVCFKNPQYPPNSISGVEGRMNEEGQSCYYAASGVQCAQAEVPNWTDRDLYKIMPHRIHAFDLPQFAKDNNCEELFLKSKEEGGYKVCQSLASHLNNEVAVTGVLYSSYQSYNQSDSGLCLALLPKSGQLVGDTYFIKDGDEPKNRG